ncbi:unnamed protein product [Blepharisma stoltei]|uniref:Uncharacterized protein n=1 Tax=Blepharisma stoltei TaxID=1481888 RepID=A0AAU9IMG9_9CILI|nr:unnamed protein product [Blepharisma stoltei]
MEEDNHILNLMQFISHIQQKEFTEALNLAEEILKVEPNNKLVLQFKEILPFTIDKKKAEDLAELEAEEESSEEESSEEEKQDEENKAQENGIEEENEKDSDEENPDGEYNYLEASSSSEESSGSDSEEIDPQEVGKYVI